VIAYFLPLLCVSVCVCVCVCVRARACVYPSSFNISALDFDDILNLNCY
jgi:hypothetical protein